MVNASILDLGTKEPLIGLEGKDLDDTPEMTKLTEEMSKLSSVANRQEPNWNLVEQCSRVILRDYVKHFQVACYYGQSLLNMLLWSKFIENRSGIGRYYSRCLCL